MTVPPRWNDNFKTTRIKQLSNNIMIKYDIYKTPPIRGEREDHFHARAVSAGVISFDKLKEEISYASSATPADVSHIIESIISQIKFHLANGESVQVGDLGTFSVGISGPCTTKRKAINATNLEVSDVHFRPKRKLISNIHKEAQFESAPIKRHSADYSEIEIEALLTDYFRDHRYITRREFESVCASTRTTAYRRLNELTSGKYPLLRREGPRNSSIYVPTPGSFHTTYDEEV
jgi:predicted histone-like DNA-binding protein